jgi:hypothetical protein
MKPGQLKKMKLKDIGTTRLNMWDNYIVTFKISHFDLIQSDLRFADPEFRECRP